MRALAVDYGEKRIGFAVSDESRMIAMPVRTATVASVDEAVRETVKILREKDAVLIVVGLPLNMNGTAGPSAEKASAFADLLRDKLGLPVVMWDERLSTSEVERTLLDAGVSRGKRRNVRDKLAATVILQSYLDAQQLGGDSN